MIKFKKTNYVLTAIYGLHPASIVLATESTKYPDIPKSHIFTSPLRLINILDGLTSRCITRN